MTSAERDILDDEPMTLAEACCIVFRGAIKPATLRAEAARGNLVIERIGRRDFVTRAAIREMRERCRVQQREPASGTTRSQVSGTSETAQQSAALVAALQSARALRKGSKSTLAKNISRRATVVHLDSVSKTS